MNSRADLELALARALSRHIGYTSGAYDLTRIFSILEFFLERPSGYRQEIVAFLAETAKATGLTAAYLEEVINFAHAMGLVETVSAREARLQRVSATELGRSLLGAKHAGDFSFYAYYQSKAVLRADADSLVPVLLYFANEQAETLQDFFISFQSSLRQARWNWLKDVFPQGALLDRVVAHISWLSPPTSREPGGYRIDVPTKNTARHHTTPRQGWLQELDMLDRSSKALTPFGRDVLASLQPHNTYFWLGPPHDVQSLLRIEDAARLEGPFEDQLNFGRDQIEPSEEELSELIEDVFHIMLASFESAKLVHAVQASLQLPVEYVNFRAYRDQRAFKWETVLHDLFRVKRGQVDRYSAHTGKVGFYRPTAKAL